MSNIVHSVRELLRTIKNSFHVGVGRSHISTNNRAYERAAPRNRTGSQRRGALRQEEYHVPTVSRIYSASPRITIPVPPTPTIPTIPEELVDDSESEIHHLVEAIEAQYDAESRPATPEPEQLNMVDDVDDESTLLPIAAIPHSEIPHALDGIGNAINAINVASALSPADAISDSELHHHIDGIEHILYGNEDEASPSLQVATPPSYLCNLGSSNISEDTSLPARVVSNPETRASVSRLPVSVRSSSLQGTYTGSNQFRSSRRSVHSEQPEHRPTARDYIEEARERSRAASGSHAPSTRPDADGSPHSSPRNLYNFTTGQQYGGSREMNDLEPVEGTYLERLARFDIFPGARNGGSPSNRQQNLHNGGAARSLNSRQNEHRNDASRNTQLERPLTPAHSIDSMHVELATPARESATNLSRSRHPGPSQSPPPYGTVVINNTTYNIRSDHLAGRLQHRRIRGPSDGPTAHSEYLHGRLDAGRERHGLTRSPAMMNISIQDDHAQHHAHPGNSNNNDDHSDSDDQTTHHTRSGNSNHNVHHSNNRNRGPHTERAPAPPSSSSTSNHRQNRARVGPNDRYTDNAALIKENKRREQQRAAEIAESLEPASINECFCFDPYDDDTHAPYKMPNCRHIHGKRCIMQWLEEHDTCPVCRKRVKLTNLLKVVPRPRRRLN